jgi:hypothetical protein
MNMLHRLTVIVSAGIGIVQPFTLWGVPYHSKVCLDPSFQRDHRLHQR